MKYFLLIFISCFLLAVKAESTRPIAKVKLEQKQVVKNVLIGSRNFPESILVAEILSQTIKQETNYHVKKFDYLGGVNICFNALESGKIDIYPDYFSSLANYIFGRDLSLEKSREDLNQGLMKKEISFSKTLGFDNNFVLVLRKDFAKKNHLQNISDLSKQDLSYGLSHNFIARPDGVRLLEDSYELDSHKNLKALEYNIALDALKTNKVDVINAYSTDSRINSPEFLVLKDDLNALKSYESILVYRNDLLANFPQMKSVIEILEGSLTNQKIIELNQRIISGESYESVANSFVAELTHRKALQPKSRFEEDLQRLSKAFIQHLEITFIAALIALLVGLSLGILISYKENLAKLVLGLTSIIQTIPSLALLALLIPVLGLGMPAAIMALILYALLPIVQNTYTGIKTIAPEYIDLANSLALKESLILWKVKLPLALPHILAGLKTSTVICVGMATLATFVGAGGLGDLIKTGIDLGDNGLILMGAIPAALLALLLSSLISRTSTFHHNLDKTHD